MFFEIIIVVCIGFSTAGITLLGFRLFGARAPKALVFTLVGLAMIVFTAWNRYTWATRTAADLPDTIHVLRKVPYSGWLEPWTFLFPRANTLVALDTTRTLSNPAHPGVFIVTLLNIEPYAETLSLQQIVDCPGHRQAPLGAQTTLDKGPLPSDLPWVGGGRPTWLFAAVCKGES